MVLDIVRIDLKIKLVLSFFHEVQHFDLYILLTKDFLKSSCTIKKKEKKRSKILNIQR